MAEIAAVLAHWQLDMGQIRERMYYAPTPRERERWHALWRLAQGWSASKVAALLDEVRASGAKIFFADGVHSSAVCLETGETEYMELAGTNSSATSAAFLRQLHANHLEPLIVIWDNGPAHGGEAVRVYLATPDLGLRALRLPAYSPDCNPDEAIWAWAREEVTANTCLDTKAKVQEKISEFFVGLPGRTTEVQSLSALQFSSSPETAKDSLMLRSPGDALWAEL